MVLQTGHPHIVGPHYMYYLIIIIKKTKLTSILCDRIEVTEEKVYQ